MKLRKTTTVLAVVFAGLFACNNVANQTDPGAARGDDHADGDPANAHERERADGAPAAGPGDHAPGGSAETKPGPDSGHAPAGFKPGTHADWCAGHQVPESLCTRCNSGLIPAFKATGDWCPEHGLPESQCLECNPGLVIERPPKSAGVAP